MALQISQKELRGALEAKERFKQRYATAIKKGEEVLQGVVYTLEVGAASFGFGLLEGRYGGVEVLGIPLNLGVGVIGHLLGYMGIGGKMAHHLHGFADGALASYLSTLGRSVGLDWKKSEGISGPINQMRGAMGAGLPPSTQAPVTDPELARLAQVQQQGMPR